VLAHLQKGSFSVHFNPTEWHGVALDECHEMKINKDAKLAVVCPSKERMAFLSNYLSFRAASVHNLTNQIVNIQQMCTVITKHGMFHNENENQGLWNFLEGKKATEEQSHDLLKFRVIGQQSFEQFVERTHVKSASTAAPVRPKRLCTFTVNPVQKRKIKLAERERKQYQRYLKRTVAWVAEHGMTDTDIESLFSPIQSVPQSVSRFRWFSIQS